jgi:Ca-activated chloride channel family protein
MKTKSVNLFHDIFPLFTFVILLLMMVTCLPSRSPAAALDLDVRPENPTVLQYSEAESALQIRIVAPQGVISDDRPPLNLALVLDKSGSMADEGKIRYVRRAAHMLVNRLGPEDVLSIVTYDNRVRVPVSARKVRDRKKFHRAIDGLYPGGRTYLSGGLEEGFRQARKNRGRGCVSRVILLSDGLANIGTLDSHRLSSRASAMYESGVSVSTFGMGLEFNEDLLASMAYGGGGKYHYISSPGDIVASLDREFKTVSRTVASGVQIIIRPSPGCRFESAPGHRWHMKEGAAVIGLGDLSTGETRTLLARMSVPSTNPGPLDVATVGVLFQDPVTGAEYARDHAPITLKVVEDPRLHRENIDREVHGKKAVIESSARMNEAAVKVDSGDREGALSIIRQVLDSLKSAPQDEAVLREMERVKGYSDQIGDLDAMAPDELEEVQKEMKYHNYQELNEQ